MKNVTGLDLSKLMAGSWGRLGAITEVSFKLLPLPEACFTLFYAGIPLHEASRVMTRALSTPFEVNGAAYLPHKGLYLRIEGFAASLRYRAKELASRLPAPETIETGEIWPQIRDCKPMQGKDGDLWRISCVPTRAPDLIARIAPQEYMLDWGGGLIWARVTKGADLRAKLDAFDGHASCMISAAPSHPPAAKGIAQIEAALRQKFDPRALFRA